MVIFTAWKMKTLHLPAPYPLYDLAALVVMCRHPEAFLNPHETAPEAKLYTLQKNKAWVAAGDLMKLDEVKELVAALESRLEEWKGELYEAWDKGKKKYVLEVFAAEGGLSTRKGKEEGSESEEEFESEGHA
ncbi:hypothetical protein FRC09_009409 [Ceratobasidium sp. 395]|nr:hypothetical protein FRC09_009409 [Ceratobasidium sp. 395]